MDATFRGKRDSLGIRLGTAKSSKKYKNNTPDFPPFASEVIAKLSLRGAIGLGFSSIGLGQDLGNLPSDCLLPFPTLTFVPLVLKENETGKYMSLALRCSLND